jgi:hypothetical protein
MSQLVDKIECYNHDDRHQNECENQMLRCVPVIPVTWEAEIRSISI